MNLLKFFPRSVINRLDLSNEVHLSVISAIVKILQIAEDDTSLLILELCISTSTGIWLNEWGSWFGVTRAINEPDALYSARIIASLQVPRVTVPALKSNVASYLSNKYGVTLTSNDIMIFEPFSRIKSFSGKGTFDGKCRYPDGFYWRNNVIDISIPEDSDNNLIKLVNEIKAAGIKVYFTQIKNDGIVINDKATTIDTCYPDTCLEGNCLVTAQNPGNRFDVNIPLLRRFYSGRKNSYCEVEIIIYGKLSYDRTAGDSYIYNILAGIKENNYKNKYNNPVPIEEHWFYDTLEVANPDEPINVQMPLLEFHVGYRPMMFSDVYSSFSGENPLSGIRNDKWNHKDPIWEVDAFVKNDEGNIFSSSEYLSEVCMIKDKYKLNELSGKIRIWKAFELELNCLVHIQGVSPDSPIIELPDIDYAGIYDIDATDSIESQPDAVIEIITK